MAETYKFVIENNGEVTRNDPVAGNKSGDGKDSSGINKGILSKDGAKAFGKVMVAYGTVKSFATQIINHEVSLVELRTGSRELQERANFANEVGQKAWNLVESVGSGALVGGWIGAIVGGVLSIGHTALGYMQNQNRINTARTVENVGLQMNYIRAGANGSRGR